MDDDLARQLIRHRLTEYRLPLGRAVDIRETAGDGQPCDACEERIEPKQIGVLVMAFRYWMPVRLHVGCYKLWEAERLALAQSASRATPTRLPERTPEQFLDNFEYLAGLNPSDSQLSVGLIIIREWMNLRSPPTVSQADLDRLLEVFTVATEGMQIYDLWIHVTFWGEKLGCRMPDQHPWAPR